MSEVLLQEVGSGQLAKHLFHQETKQKSKQLWFHSGDGVIRYCMLQCFPAVLFVSPFNKALLAKPSDSYLQGEKIS